jgi:hypothetical protein
MTTDEQDAAIVRLVRQRHEAKKRKALLENELRTAGRFLWGLGSALKSVDAAGSYQATPDCILKDVEKAPAICGLERIKAMLSELKETQDLLTQLNRSAAELGVD